MASRRLSQEKKRGFRWLGRWGRVRAQAGLGHVLRPRCASVPLAASLSVPLPADIAFQAASCPRWPACLWPLDSRRQPWAQRAPPGPAWRPALLRASCHGCREGPACHVLIMVPGTRPPRTARRMEGQSGGRAGGRHQPCVAEPPVRHARGFIADSCPESARPGRVQTRGDRGRASRQPRVLLSVSHSLCIVCPPPGSHEASTTSTHGEEEHGSRSR